MMYADIRRTNSLLSQLISVLVLCPLRGNSKAKSKLAAVETDAVVGTKPLTVATLDAEIVEYNDDYYV